MIIIRILLVLLLITICCGLVANADSDKSFKCENNTYSSTGRVKSNSIAINTRFNLDKEYKLRRND